MIKFSILVPAYNAAKYILENINSIVSQTYSKWELIIINDGSTDETLEIVNSYIKKNPEYDISVISIPNNGLANARNAAIEIAQGDYFCNLDADDFLEPEVLEKASNAISKEKCDVYYFDIIDYDETLSTKQNYSARFIKPNQPLNGIDSAIFKLQRKIWICQGVAFYRREYINTIKLRNYIGVNQGEDMFFITSALALANKVKYLPYPGACIRYRSDSMMHAPFNESLLQCIRAIDLLYEKIDSSISDSKKKEILLTLIKKERILQELRIAKSICDSWPKNTSLRKTLTTLKKYSNIQSSITKPIRKVLSKSHMLQYYIWKNAPMCFILLTKIHRSFI